MGAYDINGHNYGYGDEATYPPSARASLAMLDEMAEEDTTDTDKDRATTYDVYQAHMELIDLAGLAKSAYERADLKDRRRRLIELVSIAQSMLVLSK